MITSSTPSLATAEQRERLLKLLKTFSTAMLITHAGDNHLRARPMAIAQVDGFGIIWFISAQDTAKIHEIEEDTRVHLVCQSDHSAYLSISGRGTLVNNREKIKDVWDESYKTWFPNGVDDPEIVLISVRLDEAEYWDNKGWNKVEYLLKTAKAYVTGTTPDVDEKERHDFVKL